ncbi:MAG TPA: RNA polymerase sigma factor [Acidobacteriaceae bacterium]
MENEDRARYEWLALRCQAGEPGAFEDLIAVMERPLLYYATSLTGNQDDGLDVLQEVWIKVLRRIGELRDPGALRAWLYRITHGVAIDRIRRSRSREKAEDEQYAEFNEADAPSFAEEDAAAIHQALGEIGLKHREVLVLHFLQDLSMADIGKIVGCSEGTVRSRIFYAKKAMKEILTRGGYGKN